MIFGMESKELAKAVAKAIFYASIQASIGSVEMSSKFSVLNFASSQEVLQRAADALRSYMIIAVVWTVGTVLALYASHGIPGAWVGLIANLIMMGWIYISYVKAFKEAAKRHGLQEPTVFSKQDYKYILIGGAGLTIGIGYLSGIKSLSLD
jgi:hypothetical protein